MSDRLLSMLDRAGTGGLAAVSLIPGAGVYAWAASLQMPRPVAAVIGVYAVAGALWLCTGLRELRRQRRRHEERPDYEKWNLVTTFTLAQAASLWVERRPALNFDDSAHAIFSMLMEQAKSGGLDATLMETEFHRDSLVLRGDLMTLARRMKQRPKFLFNKGAR
jgi:4-amino-4-deoxy-L-arabinose transferase-like glycosyltransferase